MASAEHKGVGGGRPVLVTGASSGIGEACVDCLHAAGFQVLAGVRNDAGAEYVRRRHGGAVRTLAFDVGAPEAVRAGADAARAVLGGTPLWALVNCAGMVVPGPIELLDAEDWQRQFNVNVFGQVALIRGCLEMLRASQGRIVNISSINGVVAKPYIGAYCASKHALEGISDALRMELAPAGIRVVIVEPGSVRTPIWSKAAGALRSVSERAPADGRARYGHVFSLLARGTTAREGAAPSSAGDVAAAVLQALTAAVPRPRYVVGRDARIQRLLHAVLPTAALDAIILRKIRTEVAGRTES